MRRRPLPPVREEPKTFRTLCENEWVVYTLVASVAAVTYANSLNGDFVHDDIPAIVTNGDVNGANAVVTVFRNDFWGTPMSDPASHKSYRPLTTLTFRQQRSIDKYLTDYKPNLLGGHHVDNYIFQIKLRIKVNAKREIMNRHQNFHRTHTAGTDSAGQSLVSPGSCMREFRIRPSIECNGLGRCNYFAMGIGFWLSTIDDNLMFQTPKQETLKADHIRKVSRCTVCMRRWPTASSQQQGDIRAVPNAVVRQNPTYPRYNRRPGYPYAGGRRRVAGWRNRRRQDNPGS